jgi:hypothetical protein
MLASTCSFDQMMRVATYMPELAKVTSFFQVEFGTDELMACWDGFVHTSDHYGQQFPSNTEICKQFTNDLNDYAEYLEPFSNEVGSSFR